MTSRYVNAAQLLAASSAMVSQLLEAHGTPRTEEDYLALAAALERDIDQDVVSKDSTDKRLRREVVAELRRRAWQLPGGSG